MNRFLSGVVFAILLFPRIMTGQVEEEDEKMHEDPAARAHWRLSMRVNENGQIPSGALLKAKAEFDRLRIVSPLRSDAGIANWEWLGPGNIGGRIRAILVHPTVPSVIWIGSVAGGIWRTNDGGGNWFPLTDFMPNLAVTSLVMDPTNSFTLYASTGEAYNNGDGLQGAGIFKSIDGGYTWTQLPSTNDGNFQWVNRLVHHPTSSGVLLAAVANGGFSNSSGAIYRTSDGGVTWTNVQNTTRWATDVEFDPTFTNRVMAGTGSAMYYSIDEGVTWTLQTTGAQGKLPDTTGRCETAFGPNGVQYVSMDRNGGEIWRTLNGVVWTQRSTGTNYLGTQGGYGNAIWVDPANQNIIIVGGIDLYRSTNGGQSLTNIYSLHADQHAIVPDPGFNGTTNTRVYVGCDGGIEETDNILTASQPSDWNNLNSGLGITQFYGGAAAPDGSLILGGTQDNDIPYKLPPDNPGQWRTRAGACCDGGYSAIDPTNPSIVYSETQNLFFIRSDNGGQSYEQKMNGLLDANSGSLSAFIAPFSMAPGFPVIVVAGGRRIWRTVDRGDSWFQIRDSVPFGKSCTAIDIGESAPNIVWVGYADGHVARTSNGGLSWTRVDNSPPGLPLAAVTDIAINPSNTNEVFVTFGGYAINRVWLTTNNGANWLQRSGNAPNTIPAIQVNTIRFHPLDFNWIYIGTDLGVLSSEDKGITWNVTPRFASNEGPVNVEVDELFWQGTEYLLAATHGRGMFRARILQTVYVDINNTGFENGTLQFPYNTVQEAIDAAGNGSDISIKTGTYSQAPVTFTRRGQVLPRDGIVVIRGGSDTPVNKKGVDTDLLSPGVHTPPELVKTQGQTGAKKKEDQ